MELLCIHWESRYTVYRVLNVTLHLLSSVGQTDAGHSHNYFCILYQILANVCVCHMSVCIWLQLSMVPLIDYIFCPSLLALCRVISFSSQI